MTESKDAIVSSRTVDDIHATESRNNGRWLPQWSTSKASDKALEFIKNANVSVTLTEENNRSVLRKIDWHLLPLMMVAYFLQQLDKSTLSYSSVFGIVNDAHLVGKQYSWLGSVVYIAQLVFQPLIAYILVVVPPGKFLAFNMFCWGTVLSFMALATNFPGLLVTRLLLGMFEATIAPTFVTVNQLWYRRAEQANRAAAWYAMNGVSYVFGSLITWGLGHIHSKLYSYQIIFLFAGLVTVCVAVVTFFTFPDSPLTAKFLNEEERLIAIERIRVNQTGIQTQVWKWDQVLEAMLDPKTWMWTILLFCIAAPSGGVSTFGPLIIKSFNFNAFQTTLLNIPWGALQVIVIVGSAWASTHIRLRSPILMFLTIPPLVGCAMLYKLPRTYTPSNQGALLSGYYLTGFYTGITPLIYSWYAANTAGDTKKKWTTAMAFMGQSAGNIVGPLLYTTEQAPLYQSGLESNLALFSLLFFFVIITACVLTSLNKWHTDKCRQMGKEPPTRDLSMARASELRASFDEDASQQTLIDNSLRDTTDLKNEDFVYLL